ncbi:hypothetical protein P7D22_19780 [Lichenihabitans sp. Uapishka_5]|uniref:hypothetical protein n=1 Tax=Lichenihabitans sp. Uapishka_5 TaxID=3037302 RepID=UPI0029E7D168|nr:hypothetical protein [Lichenihabitans sp. Uapishka_5]MDX7953409.1 hypothetical protein [Lichenihabitans sp. Uapishka_5]
MQIPFLHTASGRYDLPAIMRRAWVRARNTITRSAKAGHATGIRTAFADALRATWDEARSARSLAAWRAEQDRQAEALAQLDARTREIAALQFARIAADGIDNGPAHRAEVRAIDTRLAALNA